MGKSDFINDCEVITITPMEVECVVINPSSRSSSDGSASISITGGTPPYNITWGNGGLGLAIYGLSVGEYPAVITDFYGDFTANTVCVLTAETTTTTSTTTTTTLPPLEEFCITYQVQGRSQPRIQLNMVGNGYDNLGNPQWIADNPFDNCEVLYNPDISQWYLTCPINFSAGGTSGAGQLFSTDSLSSNPPILEWFPLGVTLQTLIVSSGTCEESIAFLLDTSVSQPSCVCDGQITLNPSGGQPPYQYSINNGVTYENSNVYTNLCPGIYSVSVKDSLDNTINDSVTLNPLLPQTSYFVNLSTTVSVFTNNSSEYHRLFQTTLSVTPPLPAGVTIDAEIIHTGVWANTRKPGYSNLVRTVDLTKNNNIITPFSQISGSVLPATPQCGGPINTVQFQTITNTWGSVIIGDGDTIIIDIDSKLTFPNPQASACDYGTDSNSVQIGSLRINGCDCCTVVNNTFIEP